MSSSATSVGNIEAVDIGVIVAYFVVVMGFGLWSSCKNRGSVNGYFLAGRDMHFVLIGASLFASNIGSGHFIGLAGSGASTGIGIAVFELGAIFILMVLGWIFLPVYIASGVYTMPEYIQKRFGGQRIRIYLAVLALLLSIFTKVAADLYAGAVFIRQAINWDIYAAIVLLLAIAAIFTIAGGLTAVIWTDFIQTIIMIVGAIYLMIMCFINVGSFDVVMHRFLNSVPNTTILHIYTNDTLANCGYPPDNSLHFIRAPSDPGQPWPGVFFGLTISSVWYWCSDQVIVQRALASKNYSHAKAGCLLAGYLKFLPMWIMVLPGMIARILYPDEIACTDPEICQRMCGSDVGCTNVAYPTLVIRLMPTGARGLMLAVMMSALMSSLTSIFNSSSTIFTIDIWMRIRKQAGDMEVMIVSRLFVLVMVGLGIAWIPVLQNFSELFNYIQSVTSFLSPPICAVYVLAILWGRTNEKGAFCGLMVGLVIGVTRFAWESAYKQVNCGDDGEGPPAIIKNVHYLHFGMLLFGIVVIVVVVVSLLTKPIDQKHLVRLTFWDRHSKEERVDLPNDDYVKPDKPADDKDKKESTDENGNKEDFDNADATVVKKKVPVWRIALNWICGIEEHPEMELTDEQKKEMNEKQTSLDEVPFQKRLCNINAIILMTVTAFYWAFFA